MIDKTLDLSAAKPSPPRCRPRAPLLVALGLCLLGACSGSLLPKPEPQPMRFTLDGAVAASLPRALTAPGPVLQVAVPRAAPGFDSRRMVYLRRAHEVETFAFHEWVDTPAEMLAPLLVQALQGSGAFGAVVLAPSAAAGVLRLETEVIRLQQDFTRQPSQVRLTLRAVLVDAKTRQPVAWREFDESVPASDENPVAGVAAAHAATGRVLNALVRFCAEHAEQVDRTVRPPR